VPAINQANMSLRQMLPIPNTGTMNMRVWRVPRTVPRYMWYRR